jgi:hypothetical protein
MATYLNDLRLTELATGEGSGTWGTTTNTSLELIGEALGYATQQVFGSDADATTTIADGASDPARAMYFKITSAGSLTATRTCTIAPNTISRVMFIENATTGSQSIQISQGSGASVTILTGKTAVVYLDGAGAGAAVVDAMAGVDPGVTDTLAEVLAAGNTSGANNLIIDNGQAITTNTINETTAASGVTIDSVLLKDDGVNATNLEITNIKANDGTSAGSIADSTGVVTLASSVLTTADINGGTIDGTTVIGGTTPAALSATTGSFSSTLGVTGAATFSSTVAGAFNGTLGATTPASVAATTLSTTGAATFGGDLILNEASPLLIFQISGVSKGYAGIAFTAGSIVADSATDDYVVRSANGDFRVSTDDGTTSALTIAQTTGTATFSGNVVAGSGAATARLTAYADGSVLNALQLKDTRALGADVGNALVFQSLQDGAGTYGTTAAIVSGRLNATPGNTQGYLTFLTGQSGGLTAGMRLDASGRALFGHTAAIQGTKVEISAASDGGALALFGRASDDLSYIGFYENGVATRTALIQASTAAGLQFIGGSGGTVHMTLDASGNVGIGVVPEAWTAGYRALEVGGFSLLNTNGDFSSTFIQSNAYYDGAWKYKTTGLASQFVQTSGFSTWSHAVSGTADDALTWIEDIRLDASGNFLVGCTSLPSSSVKGAGFTPTATGTDLYLGSNTATGDNQIVFYNPNGLVGSISTSASATQYNTSSDPRLKSEFAPTTGALAKIVEAHDNQLIGEFHFLSDPDTTVWGYNAHALIDNQPGFGGTEGAGPRDMAIGEEYEPATFDEDGNEITPAKKVTPAGVDQSKRVPLLEAAIYDLLKMNEALTARLDAAGL